MRIFLTGLFFVFSKVNCILGVFINMICLYTPSLKKCRSSIININFGLHSKFAFECPSVCPYTPTGTSILKSIHLEDCSEEYACMCLAHQNPHQIPLSWACLLNCRFENLSYSCCLEAVSNVAFNSYNAEYSGQGRIQDFGKGASLADFI